MKAPQDPSGSRDENAPTDRAEPAPDERRHTLDEQQRLIEALQQTRELGGEIYNVKAPTDRAGPAADERQRIPREQQHVGKLRGLVNGVARPAGDGARQRSATRIWPIPACLVGMIVLSFIVLPAVGFRLGAVPDYHVRGSGIAEVRSCQRSVVYLGLAHACEATVTWEGQGARPGGERAETTVWSILPLRGTVDVVERGGREQDSRVVPASHPNRASLAMVMTPAYFVFAIVGLVMGLLLMRSRPSSRPVHD